MSLASVQIDSVQNLLFTYLFFDLCHTCSLQQLELLRNSHH